MNGFTLKLIAIITMIIDHIGLAFFPDILIYRIIGRISMPIFAFLCAEGYAHSSNREKYLLRLFTLALITEIPYDLMCFGTIFDLTVQNILFSFFLGVLALYLGDKCKSDFAPIIYIVIGLFAVIIRSDYNIVATLLVVCFYKFRYGSSASKIGIFITFLMSGYFFMAGTQAFAILSAVPILLYNGKRGYRDKYHLFYWVYPLQFFVIYIILELLWKWS